MAYFAAKGKVDRVNDATNRKKILFFSIVSLYQYRSNMHNFVRTMIIVIRGSMFRYILFEKYIISIVNVLHF